MQSTVATADPTRHPSVSSLPWYKAHPKGFWFIFWGEFAERCSYYGMMAILALYMKDRLQFSESGSLIGISLFKAGCYFLPLIGGWMADRYLGKYWTIVGFSIPYILGHVIIGFENMAGLIIALSLLAMGSGVIKPNISTLMGMTYDQQRPGQEQLRSNAFSYFYLAINIGAFLSQAVLPSIRTATDYWIAFLFPAGLMVVSFIIFALGKKHYAVETIVRTKLSSEEKTERLRVVMAVSVVFLPVIFFWAVFDQSHSIWIFFARDYLDLHLFGIPMEPDSMQAVNPFMIMALLPLMTLLWTWRARRGKPVRPTDKMLLGFGFTALVLVIFIITATIVGPSEERGITAKIDGDNLTLAVQLPDKSVQEWKGVMKRDAEDKRRITATLAFRDKTVEITRATVAGEDKGSPSLTISTLGEELGWLKGRSFPQDTVVHTRFVEPERKATLWWQVLAYLVLTIAEILISVTGLELAFVIAPARMKSFITAIWLLFVGIGNLAVNIPLAWPYKYMSYSGFFTLQLFIMGGVIVSFYFIARRFNRQQAEAAARVNNNDAYEAEAEST